MLARMHAADRGVRNNSEFGMSFATILLGVTTNLHVYITRGSYVITPLAKLACLITEFAILIATPAISTYATVLHYS